MRYTVKFQTAKKHWESAPFASLEEAERHRKFGFGRWKARGTILENGVELSSPEKRPATVSTPALLVKAAHQVGQDAADACTPTPMIVSQHENPLDDSSRIIKQYEPVMGGVCGFAFINLKPANSRVGMLLTEEYGARKDSYRGGVSLFVHEYGQSYERKTAYASAFAKVLCEAGLKATYESRLD